MPGIPILVLAGENDMKFDKLEQNIIDMIKEEQAKLGYRRENIRLYYPSQFPGPSDRRKAWRTGDAGPLLTEIQAKKQRHVSAA